MINWLATNKEWLFSGVGVVVLASLGRLLYLLIARARHRNSSPSSLGAMAAIVPPRAITADSGRMWFGRKKMKGAPSPEHVYEITLEFERLQKMNDEEGFRRFGMEHFEELSETDRKQFLIAVYEDMREKGLQIEAEQWVYDRLDSFSEGVRTEIEHEVWGMIIDAYRHGGIWKTGRKERPSKHTER